MLPDFDNVPTTNVDDRTADALCGVDDNVVVLRVMKRVQRLDFLARLVHDSLINGVGNAVVDQLSEDQSVLALVKHLERIRGKRELVAKVGVSSKYGIDVSREFSTLILVDCMGNVC